MSLSPSASASPSFGAPTGNYDISILEQNGYDVLEGLGANRSAVATQHVPILYSGTSVNPVIDGSDTLTLVIANNGIVGAQIQVDLYYATGA